LIFIEETFILSIPFLHGFSQDFMKHSFFLFIFLLFQLSSFAQTKIGGKVLDSEGAPMAYTNVIFLNSTEGTITDENGRFYLESSKSYDAVEFSFTGFKSVTLPLRKGNNLNLEIVMEVNQEELGSVQIFTGKTSKKNNPAIDILRKIWANKRNNGVHQYDQYQYDKYEKLEFDLNSIDSNMIKSRVFKGMEFIFDRMDTSSISGKNYLPIFINESFSEVYGNNKLGKEKEVLIGNRNSGFDNNRAMIDFIKDIYAEYNVYDNYLKFFDKSFVSPLSRTGIHVYNYVLADSAFIDSKWCYKIIYYPRRKNELTFKGDFWVNDTTWAIKDINLEMSKSANINWVNDVFIEQEFDVLNDSTFVITRDHFMANLAFQKKEDAYGVYAKRTTLFDNYDFESKKPDKFYRNKRTVVRNEVFNRDQEFWQNHRIEKLSENEKGIYEMLDTLKTTRAFKRLYDLGDIVTTGYIGFAAFDYGPILSTFGYNDVEGVRLRGGGRTFFGPNDMWRLEGFGAYGFKDQKFKYGISGKWMIEPQSRLKITGGYRQDVEQLGASLTNTTDVLGRSLASSSIITIGSNKSLSHIKLSTVGLEISPIENFKIIAEASYRKISAASPEFDLSYYTDDAHTQTRSKIDQAELTATLSFTPGRKTTNYGVERLTVNSGEFPEMFVKYSRGIKDVMDSDFDYDKLQLFYRQPWNIGGFGRFTSTLELGKTFGEVPLGLLNVVPGNQSVYSIFGSFPLLNYYEFVTDSYASLHLEHNFGGRLLSRIPGVRKWNLRELVGIRGVVGTISDENQALNASESHPVLLAPDEHIYWEWSVGVGNIFRFFRIDAHFKGNYRDNPDARKFGVTGAFEITF